MSTYTTNAERRTDLPTDREITVADTGAGLLVFAACQDRVGRELVAFADVTEWSVVRDALRARGLGVGATYHLPTVNGADLPAAGETVNGGA